MSWWNERPTWQKVTAGTVVGFLVGLMAASGSDEPAEASAQTTTTTVVELATTQPEPTTTTTEPSTTTTEQEPTTTLPSFTPESFAIDLIVLEDECFNTAGALVTVEPELSLLGPSLAPGQELTVIYEIHGGESTVTQRLELSGDSYSYEEHVVSTESCDHDLSVEIVNVLER